MNVNQIIFRNLKKNIKNYYLYVFALIFSVALYFAFVTLQYDPSMDEVKGSIKGGAAIRAASVMLVAIVSVFLLYANQLFIKRRSKEIGLFQLIGMTKNKIFRLLSAENFILYYSSMIAGIFIGFSVSKLIIMILFKITGVDAIATLTFSSKALIQTVIVFSVIYLFILMMNYLFIKRQSILSLFRVLSSTESKVKKLSKFQVVIGILGIILIITGYYVSSKLFSGDFTTMPQLFGAMLFILATVIIGTYLFYKGSVSFLFHLIRKRKKGYLNINEVLSLSSIMFRMKSNALLLTVITTVSALAVGLLSLSYISYYSAEKSARDNVPADFTLTDIKDANELEDSFKRNQIAFSETKINVIQVEANVKDILDSDLEGINFDPNVIEMAVVSDKDIDGIDVSPNDTIFTGYSDLMKKFISFKDQGTIKWKTQNETIMQNYKGMRKERIISWTFTSGGLPVAIVDDTVFNRLKKDLNPKIQKEPVYIGIDLKDDKDIEKANDIFKTLGFDEIGTYHSLYEMISTQKQLFGLTMFIVGFLGLTFLITSGCILYFKQMDEGEDEKPNYTILRKLGYTQNDLLRGIQAKQLFNFGIPLGIGLLHGYFAVKSGWFLFGSELWTPMFIVMLLYTALYSVFGLLSVFYYKKVIREAL
ncbi:bacitracin export permease protein BceB [Siminovitchia terrae]|uniref:ABC transporter permease n=1 Tax=Siminovitchia terrae TaxID=1914933 RepID=A0A429X8L5_SIMTE|nr:ABC transporter permease [Siminovitchia terrae]RST59744.1 ABC transporter permease [Siminovitchia terrae]GIN91632.1 bacitracin export permease protein BceB [Siminovitchia terrae]GIN95723.1 bacitracin export permease protein BceB [Siminovitchia terrae]